MMSACRVMAGKAPRRIPGGYLHAARALKAAAESPSRRSAYSALCVSDLGWAAVRKYGDGNGSPHVSLRGTTQQTRIESLASPKGMLVTPIRQFVRPPSRAPPARGLHGPERLGGPVIQINKGHPAMMDAGEFSLLLAELAFAAADCEALAIRHIALARLSRRSSAAGGRDRGAAPGGPSLACVDCRGPLTEERIAEGAEMLRGRGYGGSGLVVYEPLTHGSMVDYSQRSVMRCVGISVAYSVAPGGLRLGRAGGTAGIARVKSRALDEPSGTGGPPGQGNASIMFDPCAAFALRDDPRLWLEAWRDCKGQSLAVESTHTLRIDMNEDAVCLLLHTDA